MRAVVVADDRSLEEREVERPAPGEGQVMVRVAACGVCGSDLHARPTPAVPAGSVMGHELSGVVEDAGLPTSGFRVGDRVCVYPFEPTPEHDLVTAMAGMGFGAEQGGFAEYVAVSPNRLWRLPEGMPLEHGALVEPLAVALHGLDIAGAAADSRIAVVGAGPIGVMVALAARARGIENVAVVEPNPARRERVSDWGFPATGLDGVHERVLELLGGAPPDVVMECAGHPSSPGLCIELVAPSGRIGLLGVLEEPVEINQLLLMLKEASLHASFAYRPASFDEAIELLASGKVPAAELVTGEEPLSAAQEVFEALEAPGTEHLKVLLRP